MSVQAAPPLEERQKPPRRRKKSAALYEVVLPLIATAGLFLLWEAACRAFKIPGYLLPAPSEIWKDTLAIGPTVAGHTMATFKTVMLGFVVSILISLPLAVVLTASPAIAAAVYPFLVWTQSIPKVALAPILVVLLGTNELPRIVITVLVAFFPLVISVATGLLSVPPELIELSRACRASKLSELLRIRLPYAIPFIFAGLKVAISLAVVRRGRGGVRQCGCRSRIPDPDLDRVLQGAGRLRSAYHPVGDGRRPVPARGGRRTDILPVVEQQHDTGCLTSPR